MSHIPSPGPGRGRASRGAQHVPFHPRGRGNGTTPSYQESGRGRGNRGTTRRARGGGRGRGAAIPVEVFRQAENVPAASPEVLRLENESMKITKGVSTNKLYEASMPLRPGFGVQGKQVVLWTNYFKLVEQGNLVLYRYSIEVTDNPSRRAPKGKKWKRIIQLFMRTYLKQYEQGIVTDFKSTILSKNELPNEAEYEVAYLPEGEDAPAVGSQRYKIHFQSTGTFTVSELLNDLISSPASSMLESKPQVLQALNIAVGHHPKETPNVASVGSGGNTHFQLDASEREAFDLESGLMALRGFFLSVRAATGRLLVNVQVKHAVFFANETLDKLMHSFIIDQGLDKYKLWNFIKKIGIDAFHITKQNSSGQRLPRIKTVMSFAAPKDGQGQEHPPIVPNYGAGCKEVKFFQTDPSSPTQIQGSSKSTKGKGKKPSSGRPSISSSTGKYISVFDYFKQNYPHIRIDDPSLPVINIGTRQSPSYLPPEACMILAGQPSKAKLSPQQTRRMIDFAVRKPFENARSVVMHGSRLLGFDPISSKLKAFGIHVEPNLLTIPGRVLSSPDVLYRDEKNTRTMFGSWNMMGKQFSTRAALPSWTFLWISIPGLSDLWANDQALKVPVDALTRELERVGLNVAPCTRGMHITVERNDPEIAIDTAIQRFMSGLRSQPPKLILVVLPSEDSSIYNSVKLACDVKYGLLSVCVNASKFARANEQYHANVALKINLKLGGQNQLLDSSKLGIIAEGKTMVVGIDVTHPAPGSSDNAPSIASIVASTSRTLAQFPADLRVQTGRKEMVTDLKELCKSRLQLWRSKNGSFPENIIVYRDGVSEGQYSKVLEEELPALQAASQDVYPATMTKNNLPRLTIIIVGKRHNTRFYPTSASDADRFSNPQNGTVVDRGVTEAVNWDFFLQAHSALKGTARPAHYYVIFDQIFRQRRAQPPFSSAADVLEDLTHNMCYLFGRATKAVSICPPAYYADLACERGRCYLRGLMDTSSTTPGGSVVSGSTGRAGQSSTLDSSLVKIHENVKDSMFYI